MKDSTFKTVNLPPAIANEPPIALAHGSTVPVRVVVKNVSGTAIFLAGASGDIVGASGATGAAYLLRPDETDVFVLNKRQTLFAAGNGVGARASVAISEALPLL